jgi:hypothetical protein
MMKGRFWEWSGRMDLNIDLVVPNQSVEISKVLQVSQLRPAQLLEPALSWSAAHT